ncbi:MAG: GAF domain-containing sensor histidine kinase, partial [Candidatus Kerfeldbacteria bacterium]|nr:GAF domain-containing sensor histidine kinase [Candidatus Kerfeldbacteria bacterium]
GESFGNDDLQLIEVLGPQIGSAIQKANLYEEVRAFGERLKKRVEEATAELKERNVSLLTLQTITRDVTRTLDFNKVVQNIADSVAKRLGYVGAVLVFVDEDGKTVRARAITNTPLTNKALKLLPKPFTDYATNLENLKDKNLAHEVIRTGEARFSENFAEVVSPPLPSALARAIQKLVGVKTIVVMPIVSEEKVIGAIEIGLKKPQEEITERELETMQSLADQLGVVSRNLQLFEQVKHANLELEDANRHLQLLDQAKSEFVSIASHQLRTPMTGIMGYLSMLTAGDFGAMKIEHSRILRNLLFESQRMIRLINLFLNVSKIEAGKFDISPQPIDLLPLIEKQMHEVEKLAADKHLTLTFERPRKPSPKVMADQDKIQDVILNLLDNAIKYTNEGGVTVHTEVGPGELVVSIKDTGVGIPKDQAPELFNKFVRGSGIARIYPDGSGLGLFIAKRIMEGHRGRIWVESEGQGKGSTFSFALPLG